MRRSLQLFACGAVLALASCKPKAGGGASSLRAITGTDESGRAIAGEFVEVKNLVGIDMAAFAKVAGNDVGLVDLGAKMTSTFLAYIECFDATSSDGSKVYGEAILNLLKVRAANFHDVRLNSDRKVVISKDDAKLLSVSSSVGSELIIPTCRLRGRLVSYDVIDALLQQQIKRLPTTLSGDPAHAQRAFLLSASIHAAIRGYWSPDPDSDFMSATDALQVMAFSRGAPPFSWDLIKANDPYFNPCVARSGNDTKIAYAAAWKKAMFACVQSSAYSFAWNYRAGGDPADTSVLKIKVDYNTVRDLVINAVAATHDRLFKSGTITNPALADAWDQLTGASPWSGSFGDYLRTGATGSLNLKTAFAVASEGAGLVDDDQPVGLSLGGMRRTPPAYKPGRVQPGPAGPTSGGGGQMQVIDAAKAAQVPAGWRPIKDMSAAERQAFGYPPSGKVMNPDGSETTSIYNQWGKPQPPAPPAKPIPASDAKAPVKPNSSPANSSTASLPGKSPGAVAWDGTKWSQRQDDGSVKSGDSSKDGDPGRFGVLARSEQEKKAEMKNFAEGGVKWNSDGGFTQKMPDGSIKEGKKGEDPARVGALAMSDSEKKAEMKSFADGGVKWNSDGSFMQKMPDGSIKEGKKGEDPERVGALAKSDDEKKSDMKNFAPGGVKWNEDGSFTQRLPDGSIKEGKKGEDPERVGALAKSDDEKKADMKDFAPGGVKWNADGGFTQKMPDGSIKEGKKGEDPERVGALEKSPAEKEADKKEEMKNFADGGVKWNGEGGFSQKMPDGSIKEGKKGESPEKVGVLADPAATKVKLAETPVDESKTKPVDVSDPIAASQRGDLEEAARLEQGLPEKGATGTDAPTGTGTDVSDPIAASQRGDLEEAARLEQGLPEAGATGTDASTGAVTDVSDPIAASQRGDLEEAARLEQGLPAADSTVAPGTSTTSPDASTAPACVPDEVTTC